MLPARRLTPDDVESYAAFRREMLLNSPWAFGSSPDDDRSRDLAAMREQLASEDFAILAIFEGDTIKASAGVLRESRAKRRHIATIWGVYVTPSARGKGVGRAVVAAAFEAASAMPGVERVALCVSENAPEARRMYESLGFLAWGVEPQALRTDGHTYSEIHMSRLARRSDGAR